MNSRQVPLFHPGCRRIGADIIGKSTVVEHSVAGQDGHIDLAVNFSRMQRARCHVALTGACAALGFAAVNTWQEIVVSVPSENLLVACGSGEKCGRLLNTGNSQWAWNVLYLSSRLTSGTLKQNKNPVDLVSPWPNIAATCIAELLPQTKARERKSVMDILCVHMHLQGVMDVV